VEVNELVADADGLKQLQNGEEPVVRLEPAVDGHGDQADNFMPVPSFGDFLGDVGEDIVDSRIKVRRAQSAFAMEGLKRIDDLQQFRASWRRTRQRPAFWWPRRRPR